MGVREVSLIVSFDVRNFFRYRWWIIGLIAMNLTDLLIFSVIFTRMVPIDYFKFFIPGLIVASLFSSAFFIGREVNWEIRRGLSDYLLSLPFKRFEIIAARMISGGVRGIIYSTPFILLSFAINRVPNLIESVVIYLLLFSLAVGVAGLSVGTATLFKRFETYVTFRGLLYFALYFASSVFYPLKVIRETFPKAVYLVAEYNPLSNGADLLRSVLAGRPGFELTMVQNILVFSLVFTLIGMSLYFVSIERT